MWCRERLTLHLLLCFSLYDKQATTTSGFPTIFCTQSRLMSCTLIMGHTLWRQRTRSWTSQAMFMMSKVLSLHTTLVQVLTTTVPFYLSSNRMAEFTMDEREMRRIVDLSMREWARTWVNLIIEQTPRDRKRPPKPINRKDGQKPKRKGGVVSRGGNYYPSVTGALKSSIGFQKAKASTYDLWVRRWPASAYAKAQEFGSVHTPPRPYVRKAFVEWYRKIMASILFTFYKLSK